MEIRADGITLDQLTIFVSIADEGSFSAAARRLRRAQSAITYGIQNLELQSGSQLFDRSSYRPRLTPAAVALLPKARLVVEAATAYRKHARSLSEGVEPRLSLAVDVYVPYGLITEALKDFSLAFPTVELTIMRNPLEMTIGLVRSGKSLLGIIVDLPNSVSMEALERRPCGSVRSVVVAAPDHPLAHLPAPLRVDQVRDHMQLLLSADPEATGSNDFGAHAVNRWRVNDLGLRHHLILAGLGWGGMPTHMVEADLSEGRLVQLRLDGSHPENVRPDYRLSIACRKDRPLGPAARWLVERLAEA